MKNFAIIKDGIVKNIVVSDSKAIAEEISGETCIEYFDSNVASIGGSYDSKNKKFIAPKPFPSWIIDSEFNWQAPVASPALIQETEPNSTDYWAWNELSLSWERTQAIID